MRKIEQIHERIVNLKSQPKWFTRILYIIIWLILLPISFVIVFAGYNTYTMDACDNYMSLNYNSNTTPPTDSCFISQYNSHDGYEWTRRKYNITRKNHDGSTLLTSKCFCWWTPKYKGTTPTNGMDNCVFSGRSPAFRTINSDFTYTATFSCWWTIRYISWDTVLWTQNVNYWEKIKNPTILSEWQFISWAYLDPELTIPFDISGEPITWDLDIYVVLGCNEHYHENWGFCAVDTYNINWRDQYGALLKTDVFNYWEKIKNPTILSEWQFISWAYLDPELTIPFDIYNTIITQDFDIYVVFGCNIWYHISWDSCEINQIRFRDGDVLIITQFGSVSPIGIDSFEKEGYVFLWLFLDENYSIPFDFQNTIVEGDLDLYAKYEICPEGYHTKNNQCVSDEAGIYYEDQYIKITDWVNTFYIKDRNQWATKVAMTWVVNTSGTVYNFNYTDDALATFGTYYCWWQNRGFTLSDLGINICNSYWSSYCNVTLDISEYGPWRIWDDDTWWEESSEFVNPCNADEWEYLPTVSDWYEALSIWWDIKWYEVDSGFNGSYWSFSSFSVENYDKMWEFFDDLLSPSAPAIKYWSNTMVYIQPSSFWTAMDNSGIVWVFSNYYSNYYWDASEYGWNVPLGSYYDIDYNNYAMPVRCFIDPEYVESWEWYNVTFMDGGNVVFSGTIIKWKNISESGSIMTILSDYVNSKLWYTFSGWYDRTSDIWRNLNNQIDTPLTLYAAWTINSYTITFVDWSWENAEVVKSWNYWTQASWLIDYPEWTKTWYTLVWSREIPATIPAENIVITGTWIINSYTITFTDPSWENTWVVWTWEYGTWTNWVVNYPEWTRNWYTLSWSWTIPETVPAGNIVIAAVWTVKPSQKPTSWWGGGGWGWWSAPKTEDKCEDCTWECVDWVCVENSWTWEIEESWHNSAEEFIADRTKFNSGYSDEMNEAYQYAYQNKITTMDSIEKAYMEWNLTRIAMAKMLSQYAINVLWMTPDESRQNKFRDVSDSMDEEYDDWVTLAYQLWIMWINMPNNRFRPDDYVPRSEFVTALSRMKFKTPDWEYEWTSQYYKNHMELLSRLWIITNANPSMLELRWYVMIMLMRSGK